jgi:hypothetical protein
MERLQKSGKKPRDAAEAAAWAEAEADYQKDLDYQAEMDKKWPRMAEPDEEGIDLHPGDPRRRFYAVSAGTIFKKADPLTEEEKAEADVLWEKVTGGQYSKKPEKKK